MNPVFSAADFASRRWSIREELSDAWQGTTTERGVPLRFHEI